MSNYFFKCECVEQETPQQERRFYVLIFFLYICVCSVVTADQSHNIYTEFDDEFDDVETPLGQCTALYTFQGTLVTSAQRVTHFSFLAF